jgi:hypothetical protein
MNEFFGLNCQQRALALVPTSCGSACREQRVIFLAPELASSQSSPSYQLSGIGIPHKQRCLSESERRDVLAAVTSCRRPARGLGCRPGQAESLHLAPAGVSVPERLARRYRRSPVRVGHGGDGLGYGRVHGVESGVDGEASGRRRRADGAHLVHGPPLVAQLLLATPLGPPVAEPDLGGEAELEGRLICGDVYSPGEK